MHHQIENPNGIVMNERTDRLNFNGKQIELPVMGIFELSDGKIKVWRDYFDMEKLKKSNGITNQKSQAKSHTRFFACSFQMLENIYFSITVSNTFFLKEYH